MHAHHARSRRRLCRHLGVEQLHERDAVVRPLTREAAPALFHADDGRPAVHVHAREARVVARRGIAQHHRVAVLHFAQHEDVNDALGRPGAQHRLHARVVQRHAADVPRPHNYFGVPTTTRRRSCCHVCTRCDAYSRTGSVFTAQCKLPSRDIVWFVSFVRTLLRAHKIKSAAYRLLFHLQRI